MLIRLIEEDKEYNEEFNIDNIYELIRKINDEKKDFFSNEVLMELNIRKLYDILNERMEDINDSNKIELVLMYYFEGGIYWSTDLEALEKIYKIDKDLFFEKFFEYVKLKNKKIDRLFILKFLKKSDYKFQKKVEMLFQNRLTNYEDIENMKYDSKNIYMYVIINLYNKILIHQAEVIEYRILNLKVLNKIEKYLMETFKINEFEIMNFLINEEIFDFEQILKVNEYRNAYLSKYTYNEDLLINYGDISTYLNKLEIQKGENGFFLNKEQEKILEKYNLTMYPVGIFEKNDFYSENKYKIFINYKYKEYGSPSVQLRHIKGLVCYIVENTD